MKISRTPCVPFRRFLLVWPQLIAALTLVFQPMPITGGLYAPSPSGYPQWVPQGAGELEPSSGPDLTQDENNVPAWQRNFESAISAGTLVFWGGGTFMVDGNSVSIPGQYAFATLDFDGDGIPDGIDPYPQSAANNTFYWNGRAFLVTSSVQIQPAGYYAGSAADTDGDGLPDVLDPYPTDPNNNNSITPFWWDGGTFKINQQWVTFQAGEYSGPNGDYDFDGIPDCLDPYLADFYNNSPAQVWWQGGGPFLVNAVSVTFDGQWHDGMAGDADNDGIPDDIDPFPSDGTNNTFWWEGGSYLVNAVLITFYPQNYPGHFVDSDSDGIPDSLDEYIGNPTNNTSWWEGGTFRIDGEPVTRPGQYFAGLLTDVDGDSIPDVLDKYPNDPTNNSGYFWPGGDFIISGASQHFQATYLSSLTDSDGDGIPDGPDPFPSDATNNTSSGPTYGYWGGGTFRVNGNLVPFAGGLLPEEGFLDADGDGIPDGYDPYLNDATNNSYWWDGGTFMVNDSPKIFPAQFRAGPNVDSDSDGIPDPLDDYPNDAGNGNQNPFFWWAGGTFTVENQGRWFTAGFLTGAWADADSDGLPDQVDPYPNDSTNNAAAWFYYAGGQFLISNVTTPIAAGWYPAPSVDTDGDTIPDSADPFPNDATNNSPMQWWGPLTIFVNGSITSFTVQAYTGAFLDSDGDGLPDWADPFPNDASNNSEMWTGDLSYLVNGNPQYHISSQWHRKDAADSDADGLPDDIDPYPNDSHNNSYTLWPAANTQFLVSDQLRWFFPTYYPLTQADVANDKKLPDFDGDGIPDAADPFPQDSYNFNDTDHDGIPDRFEVQFHLNRLSPADAQLMSKWPGKTYLQAYQEGLELDPPLDQDSDQDGMTDIYEIANSLDRYHDTDRFESRLSDFVFNFEKAQAGFAVDHQLTQAEYEAIVGHATAGLVHLAGTSGAENDWDGDGVSNVDEVSIFKTDPRSAASHPDGFHIWQSLQEVTASMTTRGNYLLWLVTNSPDLEADSDHDGIPDRYEIIFGSNPNLVDSDSDGMPDWWEIHWGLDPNWAGDATGNLDADDVNNLEEYQHGTNPRKKDSDDDGMSDRFEIDYGLNPISASDATDDADNDGLSNYLEAIWRTNPLKRDTDGDGIDDATEVASWGPESTGPGGNGSGGGSDQRPNASSPTESDTDHDGVPDDVDAVVNDKDFTHKSRPLPRYAVVDVSSGGYLPYFKVTDKGRVVTQGGYWSRGGYEPFGGLLDINDSDLAVGNREGAPFRQPLDASTPAEILLPAKVPVLKDGVLVGSAATVASINNEGIAYGSTFATFKITVESVDCDSEPTETYDTREWFTHWDAGSAQGICDEQRQATVYKNVLQAQIGSGQYGEFTPIKSVYVDLVDRDVEVEAVYHSGDKLLKAAKSKVTNFELLDGFSAPGKMYCSSLYQRTQLFTLKPSVEIGWKAGEAALFLSKMATAPPSRSQWPIDLRWGNYTLQPNVFTGASEDQPAIWAGGNKKLLNGHGFVRKMNNLGQAIISRTTDNFWQNGRVHNLKDLVAIASDESIKPVDLSDTAGLVLAELCKPNEAARPVLLLPVELTSDLNNDGKIDAADGTLRDKAVKDGASDEDKAKGTEYLFINDKMSNGAWDVDDPGVLSYSYGSGYDKLPAPPATHKDDDDAEPLKVKVGATFGVVWLDHPTIDKLEFFKAKECKDSDKINIKASSPFDLSAGSLPETIYMRLRDDWAGTEQEGNLRMFFGKNVNETWAELKLPVTVVRDFGSKHFFNAARDYILENNTRVCIRDHGYPFGPSPSVIFRLCIMREEAAKMTALDGVALSFYGIEDVPPLFPNPAVIINGNQCFWSAGWDEANLLDLPHMIGNIADKCHGRVIRGSITSTISSDNFDQTTKPAKGSPLAGPDPIPAGTIAGPDGVLGTADDIPNPDAGAPGGKYVGANSSAWTFAAGRAGGADALGGLSTYYASPERADKAHQMIGYAKGAEQGKGCIFTATQIKGEGYATIFKADASIAGVPALSPSADAGAIKLFILDSGAGSLGLMHIDPAGTIQSAYIGRKSKFGFPYYVNNYLTLEATKPRP